MVPLRAARSATLLDAVFGETGMRGILKIMLVAVLIYSLFSTFFALAPGILRARYREGEKLAIAVSLFQIEAVNTAE